jgi:hypothetical protein
VAVGVTAARAVSEEFPNKATAVFCCGITDMNNTITAKKDFEKYIKTKVYVYKHKGFLDFIL